MTTRRPIRVLSGLLTAFACAWHFGNAAADAGAGIHDDGTHSWKWKLRGSAWFAMIDGDFETRTTRGTKVRLNAKDDLNFDEPYVTPQFETGFRTGRHDFWAVGTLFNESRNSSPATEFEFDDIIIPIRVPFESKIKITDINFRYGYAFRTIADDGYRLGPYVGVSYTSLDVAGHVPGTTLGDSYEDTLPIPTLGAYAEIPWGKVLIASSVGGIRLESGDFDGTGIRAEVSTTYRFGERIGLYAGLYLMYIDLELGNEDIDDLLFWGPNAGLEIRF